jgi:hypothetical protein
MAVDIFGDPQGQLPAPDAATTRHLYFYPALPGTPIPKGQLHCRAKTFAETVPLKGVNLQP